MSWEIMENTGRTRLAVIVTEGCVNVNRPFRQAAGHPADGRVRQGRGSSRRQRSERMRICVQNELL